MKQKKAAYSTPVIHVHRMKLSQILTTTVTIGDETIREDNIREDLTPASGLAKGFGMTDGTWEMEDVYDPDD